MEMIATVATKIIKQKSRISVDKQTLRTAKQMHALLTDADYAMRGDEIKRQNAENLSLYKRIKLDECLVLQWTDELSLLINQR